MARTLRTLALLVLALLLVAADAPPGQVTEPLVFTIVAAPVILGIVAAAKPLLTGREQYAGLASIVLGIGLGIAWSVWGNDPLGGPFLAGVHGVIAGLSASGLYSTVKNTGSAITARS